VTKKYIVTLTAEERATLEEMTRSGKAAARKIAHARILLKADVAEGGPGWPDEHIAAALDVSASTVRRIRLLFVEEGLDLAVLATTLIRARQLCEVTVKTDAQVSRADLQRHRPRGT